MKTSDLAPPGQIFGEKRNNDNTSSSDSTSPVPPASEATPATPSPPESLVSDSSEHLPVSNGSNGNGNTMDQKINISHHNTRSVAVVGSRAPEAEGPATNSPQNQNHGHSQSVYRRHNENAYAHPDTNINVNNIDSGETALPVAAAVLLPLHPSSGQRVVSSVSGSGGRGVPSTTTATMPQTGSNRPLSLRNNNADVGHVPISSSATTTTAAGSTSTVTESSVGSNSNNSSSNPSSATRQIFPAVRPTRESVMRRLSEALMRRSLTMIDLSQRDLRPSDARLVKLALLQNSSLSSLKLGYNNLGNEGVCTLASGIATHSSLSSIDLGFNNIGDEGCTALSTAMLTSSSNRRIATTPGQHARSITMSSPSPTSLRTLYLAGNSIHEEGAQALADAIRGGCGLKKLYLTGNRIGPDGVRVLMEAIIDDELNLDSRIGGGMLRCSEFDLNGSCSGVYPSPGKVQNRPQHEVGNPFVQSRIPLPPQFPSRDSNVENGESDDRSQQANRGLHELFLGGTGMGHLGCTAVSRMLEHTHSLRVLSLANCSLTDEEGLSLAEAITKNQKLLPIESLQLSFNELTSKGIESLTNAFMGLSNLKELRLDNNRIEGVGAEMISNFLGVAPALKKLDVGFNLISAGGMRVLMKQVAENKNLVSLSVSGNKIDTGSAKAVAYALAHNKSLKSFFLDHCAISNEGQKHITAGIVSNSRTSLQTLTGFRVGGNAVSLGLPSALGHWTNEQVLGFILSMWEHTAREQEEHSMDKEIDPLNILPGIHGRSYNPSDYSGPLDGDTVVAVAKRAFQSLGANSEDVLARSYGREKEASFDCPLSADAIILEASDLVVDDVPINQANITTEQVGMDEVDIQNMHSPPIPGDLFVRTATPLCPSLDLPTRKKKIVEWLCRDGNINHLNQLAQLPFNSSELWRLHQHYFSPTIQENWESSSIGSYSQDVNSFNVSSMQGGSSILSEPFATTPSTDINSHHHIPTSAPVINDNIGSLPILKRKVSYRHLHEASFDSNSKVPVNKNSTNESVSKLIEDRSGSIMQPKFKRARRNRSRISMVPRIKEKLDSFLDSCHTKALVLMRQLFYVEKSLLNNRIYPLDGLDTTPYLAGTVAADAEMVLLDMV